MIKMKKQYTLTGNTVHLKGTNDVFDVFQSALCFPNLKGFHFGCYRKAKKIYKETVSILDKSKPVKIFAHSYGGGIAQPYSIMLMDDGFIVESYLYGAYPACSKKYHGKFFGKAEIYGCDPVPSLFPWFRYSVNSILVNQEEKRIWWRLILQWFQLTKGDHMGYYK